MGMVWEGGYWRGYLDMFVVRFVRVVSCCHGTVRLINIPCASVARTL